MIPAFLHPRRLFAVLDEIDSQPPSWTLNRRQAMRRIFVTLAAVSVCLLLLHYAKFSSNFLLTLSWLAQLQGLEAGHYVRSLQQSQWYQLSVYAWWSGWHLIAFVLLPWLVIRFIFQQRMRDFGWRWSDTNRHWRGYLLLLSPILVLVVLVTLFREDFVDHYPFYGLAERSWLDLLAWELLYIGQFIFLEFFFRGFMVNALRPAVGANAIWIMVVPYMMIHLPKPWLEATGAILFGLFLGILALRSRSIWGGVAVHLGVALAMDFASLWYTGRIPTQLFP